MNSNSNIRLNIKNLRMTAATPAEGRAFQHGFSLALREALQTMPQGNVSRPDLGQVSLRIKAGGLPSHQGYRAGVKLAAQIRGTLSSLGGE